MQNPAKKMLKFCCKINSSLISLELYWSSVIVILVSPQKYCVSNIVTTKYDLKSLSKKIVISVLFKCK